MCPATESQERYPRVVLVGDHKQLPPVVTEETIEHTPKVPKVLLKAGLRENDTLKTSLFERLFRIWSKKTENVIILSEQYRMNEAISRIVKNGFYPTINYVPANDKIGTHTIEKFLKPYDTSIQDDKSRSELINTLFEPNKPVILVNTEKDKEAIEGIQEVDIQTESRFNIRESKIIAKVLAEFLGAYNKKSQIEIAKEIGVISPYRHQNNLIYGKLRARNLPEEVIEQIRVDTVDRFQGDEREIIILSLTNSNDLNIIGQLHRDWRRMNVSISRAKAKLIIVGNRRTFTEKSADSKEDEAKAIFSEAFRTFDELKKENLAEEIQSEKIKV
ncbi:MAG: hypothetical protein HZR80_14300 [Candidatus Heimdallarchaeota archaeon]